MFVPRANAGRPDGMTQLNLRIKPVNRAGLGIKLGECVAQVFSKSTELIIFCRARDERKFAAYLRIRRLVVNHNSSIPAQTAPVKYAETRLGQKAHRYPQSRQDSRATVRW